MSDTSINPYLSFPSTTREAMEYYQSVLGGELTLQTFGETGMDFPDEKKELIMHAKLVSDGITIMASDGRKDADIVTGTNISLSLVGTDEAYLTKTFETLGSGGKVIEPLKKQFWGDVFGMLIDRYGIEWMINITSDESKF